MPVIAPGVLATKVRGVAQCQGILYVANQEPEKVERVSVDRLLNVYMKFYDRAPMKIGRLHFKWSPLIFKDIEVTSWQLTGGWPTGYKTRHGELLARIGVNLRIRIKNGATCLPERTEAA